MINYGENWEIRNEDEALKRKRSSVGEQGMKMVIKEKNEMVQNKKCRPLERSKNRKKIRKEKHNYHYFSLFDIKN